MREPETSTIESVRLPATRRKTISLTADAVVRAEPLLPGGTLPLLIRPVIEGVDLVDWAAGHRALIEQQLVKHGAILLRDFRVKTVAQFEQFIQATSTEVVEYRERSSPRSLVSGYIYTSTDYPADQTIFLHNENSYQRVWPLKIYFFCVTPARQGGETPIADCRRVLQRISRWIRERFIQKKWMYVRNFGDGFGLPWQTVFQTTDRAAVQEYCRQNGVEFEWKEGDRLRTRAVRPAVVVHPRSGELVWFNHATFFHVSTLEPGIREALLAEFPEHELPHNTYYGDGSPIEPSVVEGLREAYRQETVMFPWQEGDILMVDNILTAHGRQPFDGPRKILVGMAEPFSHEPD
jgi:alpha-ketoglutarate-dependent taurine dioxygenase